MVFIDMEKAFDRVPREVIWWALRRKGVSEKLVRGVQEMYKDVATAVRLDGQHSEYFPVEVGVSPRICAKSTVVCCHYG